MSIESRGQRHVNAMRRRRIVIAAALGTFLVVAVSAVAFWSADSWREQAMSSDIFPNPPGGGWTDTSNDSWGATDGSDGATPGASTSGSGTATAVPTNASPSEVPTRRAAYPQPSAPLPAPTSATTTESSSPRPTNSGPKRKPKPTPPNKPEVTASDQTADSCLLLVAC